MLLNEMNLYFKKFEPGPEESMKTWEKMLGEIECANEDAEQE